MAKQSIAKRIAAAQEAGRTAAHDWEPGGISNSDHRLRSLMNFERDVVKSTWDDTEALPQWNAFLQAYDTESNQITPAGTNDTQTEVANISATQWHGVGMDEKRTARFYRTMSRLKRSIHSLEVAGRGMQGCFEVANDCLDPCQTIRAFAATTERDIELLFQMMAHEEQPEVSDA